MGFGDIFNSIVNYFTTEKQDADLNNSLALFKEYLNDDDNEVVRMWVSNAPGYGHQTSTVHLLYQLVDSSANNGFEYTGTIEVYYVQDQKKTILTKLYQLLPELDNNPTGTVVDATVKLIEWTEGDPPNPVVNLGFTGAEDQIDDNGKISSPNLAQNLNTNYFLRLEPYLWTTPEEIQFLNTSKTTIDLTQQSLLNYGAFKQRAYWTQIPVPEPDWSYYSDNGYASQVAVLQSLLAKVGTYDLGVAYSIRTQGNYELQAPPEERMFEVIAGYLASQMSGTSTRTGAKPIVVLSMDNFTNRTEGGETPLSQLIDGDFSATESTWNLILERGSDWNSRTMLDEPLTEKQRNQYVQDLKPHTYRASYLTSVNAADRVKYVWNATAANVEDEYSWLDEANNNLLFVQVGRVPEPIFNYLMYKAAMPAVFEGQNTGNLALQFGRPYFHVARPSSSNVQYPTTLLGYTTHDEYSDLTNIYMPVVYVPTIVYEMQQVANQINFPLSMWPSDASKNPAEIIGTFIKNYVGSTTGEYQTYYKSIGDFYQQPENDKFRVGLSFLGYILQSEGVLSSTGSTMLLAEADTNPLNDLLAKLYDNLSDSQVLDLFPGVYSAGPIFDFISGLLGVKVSLTSATIDPAKGTADPDTITVTGNSDALDNIPLAFEITFTAPEGSVMSEWKMSYDGEWYTDQLPWFQFENPYVSLTVANTIVPSQGGVGGKLSSFDQGLDLAIRLPIDNGLWQVEGHFETPASISQFYQMAGGVNLVQSLPSPFNALSDIGVTNSQLAYNTSSNAIEYVSFVLESASKVQLMDGLYMDSITMNVLVQNPGSVASRKTSWSVMGTFTIGTGDDAGVVAISMQYPGPILSGQLASGVIKVADLFNLFLPGTVFNPDGALPEVTEFIASFDGTTGNYSVTSKLNFDWKFQIISGAPSVTINEVGVRVAYKDKKLDGGLSGGFTFGEGDTAFSITLTASYNSDTGWIFAGQQDADNVLNLTALANQLLPSSWQIPAEYDYGLQNLNFTFQETQKYYEIGGETDGYWKIPFIDLKVRADLKFGYGNYSNSSSSSDNSTLTLVDKKTNTYALQADSKAGYYCMLNADIEWIGIKMNVFYNYNPDVTSFGFTWGVLSGVVTQNTNKEWVGTLKFTDSVSLGWMVEEAVSWATGYKYSLASPWNVLNSLSLSALELVYNFTTKTVSFNLDIKEINLGFCTINKIGLNYESGNAEADKNGVFITIDGSFFWMIGQEPEGGVSADQIKWDATKPETTPAPSGQGNKYFDLRMLALGQHVSIPGFSSVTSVQQAICEMGNLKPASPDAIPNITFDANSAWMIGFDIGVLKLQKEGDSNSSSSDTKSLAATSDSGSGYFIDLQIVFNDPNLYALRIALSGEPARIFKGLDFQILYRKISDSVGVYQAEITLPDVMRKIQLGQVNITLPVFGIEIYTNGDFLVDLGFPYNADFSRSFTLQTIIYVPFPIPIMGSAGLYFGKKSSATSTEVPQITNGTFNPVILFGVGIQFGLGYDFNAGILAAGFSLTFVTIIEGVLAKFNPYRYIDTSTGEQADIAPSYYYSVKGVVGIQGKLYGYVDFKIIKAEVNVALSIMADITITAYEPILLGLTAKMSVSVSVKINLGLFKITISFSFKMTIRESYEIKVGSGSAPWQIAQGNQAQSLTMLRTSSAAQLSRKRYTMSFLAITEDVFTDEPTWSNLEAPTDKAPLTTYIGLGLSMAGDIAQKPADQLAVYSAMLFIESVASSTDDPDSAKLKATGDASDTSFEVLTKQVFRWVIAAFHQGAISADDVDDLVISKVRLQEIYDYLNNDDNNTPIPVSAINDFMDAQTVMTVSHPSTDAGTADATFFPMAPQVSIDLPAFGDSKELSYSFDDYNSLSDTYITDLREYFDELAVQVQDEMNSTMQAEAVQSNDTESMATFIFADYYLLLARQMVQDIQNALDAFSYPIVSTQTVQDVVDWVNTNGQFTSDAYTVNDLFESNKSHVLTTDKVMIVNGAVYGTVSGDTFDSIASNSAYNSSFTDTDLATLNQDATTILQSGAVIDYTGKDAVVVQAGNSLSSIADGYGVAVSDLLANSNVLKLSGLLLVSAKLTLPAINGKVQDGDTLTSFSARYSVSIDTLADDSNNASIVELFDINDNDGQLVLTDLPQFNVGELITEVQATQGLQQLSGMASRYYLSGLRLPVTMNDGASITPKYQGMWVNDKMEYEQDTAGLFALTGQQFPIPVLGSGDSYEITFTIPSALSWMTFSDDKSTLALSITEGSDTYSEIKTVRDYAQANYLDLSIEQLGLGDMFSSNYGHYSFSTVTPWQVGAPLVLPYGGTQGGSQSISIWTLPNDLIALADPTGRMVTPRFQVEIGTVDPATKAMSSEPINNYGWGTQVSFTVKKVPASADSPASATTYEISGADGNNALILEQMVNYLGDNNDLVDQIAFAYTPDQSGGSNPGVQTDPISDLTIGIAQANLSTFTRPDSVMMMEAFAVQLKEVSEQSNLLNSVTELITLLWQASITRDGGYYLYYYNSDAGEGLPDQIFNDKGEAVLSLLTIYSNSGASDTQNLLEPCMNMFVTGDPVNVNDNSLFAKSDPVKHTVQFSDVDTLDSLSYEYFTNIGDIVEDNPDAVLTAKKEINVAEGTYQVKAASGETLSSIASTFGVTEDAIKQANPLVTTWPDTLPLYTGLRLPPITVAAGGDNSKTLLAISLYYGMDLTSLAYYNRNVSGLYVDNTSLTMRGGPVTRQATVPAGVVSIEAVRDEPSAVPDKWSDANYAELFLQNDFSILAFELMDNSWFNSSNPSLPAGPTDSDDPSMADKWVFKQSVPYSNFANELPNSATAAGLPNMSNSPYLGIGYLVQPDFEWCDIYGNIILTTLEEPQQEEGAIVNEPPILTGYTDSLLAINQWPSTSTGWYVTSKPANQINLPISFDTTQYNGLLSAKATDSTSILLTFTAELDQTTAENTANYKLSSDLNSDIAITSAQLQSGNMTVVLTVAAMAEDVQYTLAIGNIQNSSNTVTYNGQATYSYPDVPSEATSSIVQQATQDLQVYTQLLYQLTDPAGVEMSMQTSLFDDTIFAVSADTFSDLVNNWIVSIYKYLDDRSKGGTTVAAPTSVYTLSFSIDPTKVNDEQIFEILLSFTIQRTGGAVMGEFETTGGIKSVSTNISPSTDSGAATLELDDFADTFETTMSIADKYYLKVATGADRDKLGEQKPDGTIWAVRLGIDDEAIAYSIKDENEPALFAPRPISNKLESRKGVNIYTYTSGTGIDFDTPAYQKDFTEIDLDMWVGTFFSAVDNILTPEFTASIQLIDKKLGTSYLKSIQDSKESLADIAKLLMVPVYEGETADTQAVQSALKQALLTKLMNLYATNSGIQFDVTVKADTAEGTPPNLYGNFMQNTIFEGAVSEADALTTVTLYFNAALNKDSAANIANYTLTDPLKVKSATLAADGKSVQLKTSANVAIGTTTVTISSNLLDANLREVQGEDEGVISTDYVSYSKPDQLTITSAKISLDESEEQPLAFLLTTPEIVRGQQGEVLSEINLNLSYKSADIEHQIAAPINGFTPSSWLSFVLPNTRVETLESQLGGFFVPMFLRSFPQNPSLVNQSGTAPYANSADISQLLEWDYVFNYSQTFHYPQDTLNFTVNFNVGDDAQLAMFKAIPDAFNQLAEFVTVYPSIDVDLQSKVNKIDAQVYDEDSSEAEQLFKDSGIAMNSFVQVVQNIVQAAEAGNGLTMNATPKQVVSLGAAEPYSFNIQEGPKSLEGQFVQVVTVYGKPPAGIEMPQVLISPDTYEMKTWTNSEDPCEGDACYYYVNSITGEPLLSTDAQNIAPRQVIIPGMNILQRQDAMTDVYLTRNENLVQGKTTSEVFVYTTGDISFSNACMTTINSTLPSIEIADLPNNLGSPTKRTLLEQLQTLMSTLLKENSQPTLSFQMTCSYDYNINSTGLSPVNLPVVMQTMISVTLATGLDPMLQEWTDSINNWMTQNKPSQYNGTLKFSLTIFSNLTTQPYPLVVLDNLELSLKYIATS